MTAADAHSVATYKHHLEGRNYIFSLFDKAVIVHTLNYKNSEGDVMLFAKRCQVIVAYRAILINTVYLEYSCDMPI